MATIEAVIGETPTLWADVAINTMMTDNNSESDGYTSEWVTHLRLDLNLTDLPNDAVLAFPW